MTDDKFHYEHDDRDNCPHCNRSLGTCQCEEYEIEDMLQRQDEEREFFRGQMKLWERGYDESDLS